MWSHCDVQKVWFLESCLGRSGACPVTSSDQCHVVVHCEPVSCLVCGLCTPWPGLGTRLSCAGGSCITQSVRQVFRWHVTGLCRWVTCARHIQWGTVSSLNTPSDWDRWQWLSDLHLMRVSFWTRNTQLYALVLVTLLLKDVTLGYTHSCWLLCYWMM